VADLQPRIAGDAGGWMKTAQQMVDTGRRLMLSHDPWMVPSLLYNAAPSMSFRLHSTRAAPDINRSSSLVTCEHAVAGLV